LHSFGRRCYRRRPLGYGVSRGMFAEQDMEEPTLTDRVEILEETVRELATLPKRVEAVASQILQLREDMRSEFSAMRDDVRSEFAAIRQEIRDGDEETRRYMRILHEEVLGRIDTIAEGRNTP
jgi:predicted  nucleic acid-binding Zn-ribbon protein